MPRRQPAEKGAASRPLEVAFEPVPLHAVGRWSCEQTLQAEAVELLGVARDVPCPLGLVLAVHDRAGPHRARSLRAVRGAFVSQGVEGSGQVGRRHL